MNDDAKVQRLPRPDGNTVAYATTPGRAPTVAFLGGFRSDMTGTKALALEAWAEKTGRAYLRFDGVAVAIAELCVDIMQALRRGVVFDARRINLG